MEKEFHTRTVLECYNLLGSNRNGLKNEEANKRLAKLGENKLKEEKKKNGFFVFLSQFADIMIIILLIASAISISIAIFNKSYSELLDGFIILGIVLLNAIIGFVQEKKAENSLDALKKLTEPYSKVFRDDKVLKIHSKNLVQGDIILLEAGDIVPADCRLIESASLQCNESSLTGESVSTYKDSKAICNNNTVLAERHNMVFSGTIISNGRAVGIVVATGQNTQIGKIAELITHTSKDDTPLQKGLKQIGKIITYLVLLICAITFFIEIFASPTQPLEAFLTAVAIAVAAIPESLPAVITIIMSLGIFKLAKRKAIVKRLHAVETLGSCEIICSDKTGTLTENKMAVQKIFFNNNLIEKNEVKNNYKFIPEHFKNCMLLCQNVEKNNYEYIGDPTEIAIVNFAENYLNLTKKELEKKYIRASEIPFDSNRKLMSTIHANNGEGFVYTKGAIDELLKICEYVELNNKIIPLSQNIKDKILKTNKNLGFDALRILGFAYKKFNKIDTEISFENKLIFVGLVAMQDPPRKEVKKAVEKCKTAGITPIMITGDHKNTAFAIAKQIGIATNFADVLTGAEIDNLNDENFEKIIFDKKVFARVSPENKVRIVETFKRLGKIVAMTGDGVNDAPSIKKANIGVGMGITGTDVTKEVADLIITDDNFATIIVAVEEGRKIYTNIQKTVQFLFSANLAEITAIFLATIFFPQIVFLTPVQILFVNLISDTLPAIALGLEPAEKNIMQKKPRKAKANLFSCGIGKNIIIMGLFQGLIMLGCFILGNYVFGGEAVAMSMAFYALNIIQFFYFISMRTSGKVSNNSLLNNKWSLFAVAFCFGIMLLIAFTPLHTFLGLVSIPFTAWLVIFAGCIITFIFSELIKKFNYCK